MKTRFPANVRWFGVFVVLAAGASVLMMQSSSRAVGEPPANASPSTFLTSLGFKFDGSSSCSASKCHGAETSVDKKNFWGNEYTLWHGRKDPHHTAFRTLVVPKAKQIAAALKIPSALKSERCLNCHSTLAVGPGGQDLKGQEYSPAEGVSCNSCHGPSQKYREPHSVTNWIDGERAKLDHGQLLTTMGLYDTVPVLARAQRCTSCHLAIEPDLVAAGHPQPTFEMNHFTNIYPDRHWHDPAASFPAELWASGQLAELHDALLQLSQHAASKAPTSAAEFKKAFDQTMAHYSVFSALIETKLLSAPEAAALDGDMKKVAASEKDLAAAGAAASAAAEHCKAAGLGAAVAQFKPDAAAATKLMSAIAASDCGAKYGPRGQEQQAYAIEALAQASGNAEITKTIAPALPPKPGDVVKADDFAKALAEVRGKLPK